jgi:hypothetical protein
MKSSNASPSAFGWDFQCNAAIMLMLKNIKVAAAVKVEGNTEDIEITLNNDNVIYSQAKSVNDPYNDFSNVISKLKAGLKTLNNAATMPTASQLIYVTNSPNPFNKMDTMGAFSSGLTALKYNDLPESCKQLIEQLCIDEGYCFDRSILAIYVMQFHGDGDNRYKIVKELTNEFLNAVGVGDRGIGQNMLEIWQNSFFTNASQHDTSLSITKQQMVWPLIVKICDVDAEDALLSDCNEGDIDDIINRYKILINNNSERFEFVTKVLTGYDTFDSARTSREKTKAFIEQKWEEYANEFDLPTAEADILETIVKLAISNVVKRHRKIVEIKSGVNL